MTAKELAEKCHCSVQWIYHLAKKLKRLPTEQEVKSRQGKIGRPTKYREV